jgi:Ca2+-transporting ATPase
MVFSCLVTGRMAVALSVRSSRRTIFATGPFGNRPMIAALFVTLLMQMAVVYTPMLGRFFTTVPLEPGELGLVAGATVVLMVWLEGEKVLRGLAGNRGEHA